VDEPRPRMKRLMEYLTALVCCGLKVILDIMMIDVYILLHTSGLVRCSTNFSPDPIFSFWFSLRKLLKYPRIAGSTVSLGFTAAGFFCVVFILTILRSYFDI
jgi:hypothetical protein